MGDSQPSVIPAPGGLILVSVGTRRYMYLHTYTYINNKKIFFSKDVEMHFGNKNAKMTFYIML